MARNQLHQLHPCLFVLINLEKNVLCLQNHCTGWLAVAAPLNTPSLLAVAAEVSPVEQPAYLLFLMNLRTL